MRNIEQVKYEFTPQGKLDPGATQRLMNVEVAFKELGILILDQVPDTDHRKAAMSKLLVSKMLCSQAISHPGQAVQAQLSQPTQPEVNTKKESTNGKEKASPKKH